MPSQSPASAHTLTRQQVADRLGISTSSVRRMEWDKLHPVQDERGVWRFDDNEVKAIASEDGGRSGKRIAMSSKRRRRDPRGRVAARVFIMFARRKSLREIVVATKQSPEAIRALYREWSTTLEEGEWQRRRGA